MQKCMIAKLSCFYFFIYLFHFILFLFHFFFFLGGGGVLIQYKDVILPV